METCKDCFFYKRQISFEVAEETGLCYSQPPTPSVIIYNGSARVMMNRPVVKASDRLCINNILMDSKENTGEKNESK